MFHFCSHAARRFPLVGFQCACGHRTVYVRQALGCGDDRLVNGAGFQTEILPAIRGRLNFQLVHKRLRALDVGHPHSSLSGGEGRGAAARPECGPWTRSGRRSEARSSYCASRRTGAELAPRIFHGSACRVPQAFARLCKAVIYARLRKALIFKEKNGGRCRD